MCLISSFVQMMQAHCADDASSKAKMLMDMDQVSLSCDKYHLSTNKIKIKKKRKKKKKKKKKKNEPTIILNGQNMKVVDQFIYFGSTLSRAVKSDDEIAARIAKASVTFRRLRANVSERNGIKFTPS